MSSKHVFVITVGNHQTGSTKFRIVQYEQYLKNQGITIEYVKQQELNESHLTKMAKADLVINQKCLLGRALSKKIVALGRPVIFEFDDSIYTRPGKPYSWITRFRIQRRLKFWIEHARCVTTPSAYLQDYAKKYKCSTEVIPMALDLGLWQPREKTPRRELVIGWAGAPVNLHHIQRLELILASILESNPHVSLAIYSGERPKLSCRFEYTPFRDGNEQEFIRNLDIGLLPLTDEEYSRGKSPIKAIQYLSCGVPVVGNVFGATKEILRGDNSIAVSSDVEWKNALTKLIGDSDLRLALGAAGRQHILTHHDIGVTQKRWLGIIEGLRG